MRSSESFDLAILGGVVVTASARAPLNVYVSGGRIAAVTAPSTEHYSRQRIDAAGLVVLPGMVDTHVHLMDPGDVSREDFPSGTSAAICAGVTTIVEHTHGWPVTSVSALADKKAHLAGRSYADYGLAAHVWPDKLAEMGSLWRAGATFFKIFTCSTHGVPAIRADLLPEVLAEIARLDARALVHCEDDLITAHNEKLLREAGRVDPGLLNEWRSREAELVAIGTVCVLARLTGAAVTIAHVSSADAARLAASQRDLGSPAVAETCPQYLLLQQDEVLDQGALRKFTPPARIRTTEEADALWEAINAGAIHHLSSDHAPSTLQQKAAGTIWEAPFGLPGLDTTLPLMIDAALSGRISLERLAGLYAEAPRVAMACVAKGVSKAATTPISCSSIPTDRLN